MIEKYARIAKFGQAEDDKIRFQPTQAMLLDAMLDAEQVRVDKGFQDFRKKLRSFSGVKPKSAPRGFKGKLRSYQSEGLGWLHFLREFKLGGCLADDMGLGKTIQVLALLESRRIRRIEKADSKRPNKKKEKEQTSKILTGVATLKRKPSIIVVPKSLIFNWIEEAAKFTPKLRILNYTGTLRQTNLTEAIDSGGFDILLTTYGTMRKDISDLSQVQFDYAILDESQAIKNSKAQCAKSSRLLKANHRLAMTGTPIENHLGELWSLFEFLNPGMLGGSTNFARLTNQKKSNAEEREETLRALSTAIAPFLLRRTKEQVLTDLPPKTEQTLHCDMLPAQKKAYQELKEYYRVKLAKKVETDGIGRSKIQVLEALLRLRQVACDPRLLDKKSKTGAKLELLRQQLTDIISEGHKVLVFSQFTSFLSLVKQQFDDDGINYEYLDGKSSNRAASVKRFQNDESVSAFLISIKAGGHGLNLTAADYVFLLDPWWNPAVEAQAIDRAHRMGQQNPVIAYRMICRDTVEEKIVSLQQSKRDLADKIVRSDESLIRSMTADDLKILFE
jgi:SNF2 family DNA or RNA helicase